MKIKTTLTTTSLVALSIAAIFPAFLTAEVDSTSTAFSALRPPPPRYVVTTSNTIPDCIVLDLHDYSVSECTAGPCLDEFKLDKMLFHKLPAKSGFVQGSTSKEIGHYSQINPSLNFEPIRTNDVASFAIGVFEVTQRQYELVTGEPHGNKFVQPDRAKDFVSWIDATETFIKAVNKKLTNYRLRLPTDTEWEYACRAGHVATQYAFGYSDVVMTDVRVAKNLDKYASYLNGAPSADLVKLDPMRFPPVGAFPPNDFKLYDMHGGVWEWCEDNWTILHDGKEETPEAVDKTKKLKVVRGGGYWFNADDCRAANRHGYIETHRNHGFGFRVVLLEK